MNWKMEGTRSRLALLREATLPIAPPTRHGGDRSKPLFREPTASFHTGMAAVAHFCRRVKAFFRPAAVVIVMPEAMSFEAYSAMLTDMVGEEPQSKIRRDLASFRDCCLELARHTEDNRREDYYDLAMSAADALKPQYLAEPILDGVYRSLMAEADFVESLL